MIITLQYLNGNNNKIEVDTEDTILTIKEKHLSEPPEKYNLIYSKKILEDSAKITEVLGMDLDEGMIKNKLFAVPRMGSINEPLAPPEYESFHTDIEILSITLKFLNGKTKTMNILNTMEVSDFKKRYLFVHDFNLDEIKLILAGKILSNEKKFNELNISEKSFIVALTSSRFILDSLFPNDDDDDDVLSLSSSPNDNDTMNEDLFDNQPNNGDEEVNDDLTEDQKLVIQKNNQKIIELMKDNQFNTLVDVLMNKPEYLDYALKFVQSGMIFLKPENDNQDNDYSFQQEEIHKMGIFDEAKIGKALEMSCGDIQMSIRLLFQNKYDTDIKI